MTITLTTGELSKLMHRAAQARYQRTEKGRATMSRYKQSEKGRATSRKLVNWHIQAGNIVRQPCEVCGAPKSHAHHDDHSRPLDVRWLCPKHHREEHQ